MIVCLGNNGFAEAICIGTKDERDPSCTWPIGGGGILDIKGHVFIEQIAATTREECIAEIRRRGIDVDKSCLKSCWNE